MSIYLPIYPHSLGGAVIRSMPLSDVKCYENPKTVRAFVIIQGDGGTRRVINIVLPTQKDRNAVYRYLLALRAGKYEVADYEFGYPRSDALYDARYCRQVDLTCGDVGPRVIEIRRHRLVVYEVVNESVNPIPLSVFFTTSLQFSQYDDPVSIY